MSEWLLEFERVAPFLAWTAVTFALTTTAALVVERSLVGIHQARRRRIRTRYGPLIRPALEGDAAAREELSTSPVRHRLTIAGMLVTPLIDYPDRRRIETAQAVMTMTGYEVAGRYLRSWLWWRRALALRVLGLVQAASHAPQLVAGLSDAHPDVRAAALDALMDLRDPATVPAIVERVHDTSLHRGRRGAALKAFGSTCEALLLERSTIDPAHRLNCIHALAICGTGKSRPVLCGWTLDPRVEVRAAAFEALAYVGLDDEAAQVAIDGLESPDPQVRAMAAYSLRGWEDPRAAAHLARRLDDTWIVAVQAARTLHSMGAVGAIELEARAARPDLSGILARQMLWQAIA